MIVIAGIVIGLYAALFIVILVHFIRKIRTKKSLVKMSRLIFLRPTGGGWVLEVNRTAAVTTHSGGSTPHQTDMVKQEIKPSNGVRKGIWVPASTEEKKD